MKIKSENYPLNVYGYRATAKITEKKKHFSVQTTDSMNTILHSKNQWNDVDVVNHYKSMGYITNFTR